MWGFIWKVSILPSSHLLVWSQQYKPEQFEKHIIIFKNKINRMTPVSLFRAFTTNFEQIWCIVPLFFLLTLKKPMVTELMTIIGGKFYNNSIFWSPFFYIVYCTQVHGQYYTDKCNFFGYVKDADRIKFRAFYFLNAKNIILVCVVIFNSKAAKFYSDKKKFVVNKFLG